MLRTDLIELINKGDVWAFVGAGASADAGAPTWARLTGNVIATLPKSKRDEIIADPRFIAAQKDSNFPKCFSRIENAIGRPALEAGVTTEINRHTIPGDLLKDLADWPFAGYVTTNYDTLIRRALQVIGHAGGWADAGNSDTEIRKLSGSVDHLIWHLHGAVDRDPSDYRLVISEEDYDHFYLETSRVANQLKSLLTQTRIVFLGFSFEDAELKRLLKIAALYCNPARPAFAFLSGLGGSEGEQRRMDLLERFNVDVIPYEVVGESHARLLSLMRVYGSFVLKRSQKFGQPQRRCPSYHHETTSLLVYNKLAATKALDIEGDTLGSLLKARVISLLKFRGSQTFEALADDLAERIRILQGSAPDDIDSVTMFINRYVRQLIEQGFVEGTNPFSLTEKGADLTEDQAAAAKTLHEQFASSLEERARHVRGDDESVVKRVAKVAESFFASCIAHRALGVAMTLHSTNVEFRKYHIVALLQNLPEFISQLRDIDEALILVELVQGFLAQPTDAESRYIGVALQAEFAVTLLGYDQDLVQSRVKNLSGTLFLVDASMLIHALARSSVGHESARSILSRLEYVKAQLATTGHLVTELAEHARWARDHIRTRSGLTPEVLIAVTGHAGLHENLFLDGFLREVTEKGKSFDFDGYLDSVCGDPNGHTATDDVFQSSLGRLHIPSPNLNQWEGFTSDLYGEREEMAEKIAERRAKHKTYRHGRQVQAEAEALIIVEKLREGGFLYGGARVRDAYFISNTRAIDQVKNATLPVTMRPGSLLQWLNTLTPTDTDELTGLVSALLWEMSENGYTIVDKKHIQNTFSPLISASEDELKEQLATNRALMANRYGEGSEKAFAELRGIEVPVVLHSIYAQRAADLERKLQSETAARQAAVAKASLDENERQDYLRLKAKQKEKHLRAKSKQRAAKSSQGKNKKKRKGRR
jgi:hypothetical protein